MYGYDQNSYFSFITVLSISINSWIYLYWFSNPYLINTPYELVKLHGNFLHVPMYGQNLGSLDNVTLC